MAKLRVKAGVAERHPITFSALLTTVSVMWSLYKIPFGHPWWAAVVGIAFVWLLFFGVSLVIFGPFARLLDKLFNIERY